MPGRSRARGMSLRRPAMIAVLTCWGLAGQAGAGDGRMPAQEDAKLRPRTPPESPAGEQEVVIRLKDGSRLVGRIVAQDEHHLELVTRDGADVHLPRSSVESTHAGSGPAGSITAGIGMATHGESRAPILMVGGQTRPARRISLLTENWIVLDGDTSLGEQPFSVALRFAGGRVTADFGFVLVAETLDEGFPIPWLSFSYHFGPSRNAASTGTHR